MNSKMTTNSQLSTNEPKKNKEKQKLSKQLEQEQNHRNGGHIDGCLLYTSDAADEERLV